MALDIQFQIKNNPNYLRYIRENSIWYKWLNRDASLFPKFEEEVKEKYGMRPGDRITKALETIELLQNIFATFK